MTATIDVIIPVFGLILAGYLMARTPAFPPVAIHGMINFVFLVATPALLFRSMAKGLNTEVLDFSIVIAYYSACLILFVIGLIISRMFFSRALAENTLFAMGCVFSNTVLLGVPIIYMAFGEEGVVAQMMIILFHSSLLLSGTTALMEFARGGGVSWQTVKLTAKALVGNPIILSLLVGALWGLMNWPIPRMLDRFTDLLAGAAAPAALFALGGALTQFPIGGELRQSISMTLLKLFLHPFLVWVLVTYVLEMPPVWAAVAVVTAALPSGSNVYVLAQRYETYVARAASGVVISTALSVITVGALVAYYVGKV